MSEDPRADLVAQQYRRWQYPEPIADLEIWLGNHWERFDPSHSHRMFWPDRPYQPEMDILVAGCGTNQAPTIAYTNPTARVIGIDISKESLDHGRYLKHKHGLRNLELRLLPIEEAGSLDRRFDLIVCSGVLHHMASPQAGMDALAGVLRPEGVAAIMLYARYGRIGVEMMQAVFREMGLRQDEESLRLVRAGLAWLDPSHPVRTYLDNAPDLGFDAGLVDTFLHGRDVSFTVADCLDLVQRAGLVFQGWFQQTPYHAPTLVEPDNEFLAAVSPLPERQMWTVMEPLRNGNGCHLFTACRPERPGSTYRVDFADPRAPGFVPLWRLYAGVDGSEAVRPGWRIPLSPTSLALACQVDGERSIREIAARAAQPEQTALDVFEQLWRLDFAAIDLSGVTAA
ncbi:MAG: class I SAM-dependent methyltransferase [Mycobacterium sp.]